jgi:hypothetical protein
MMNTRRRRRRIEQFSTPPPKRRRGAVGVVSSLEKVSPVLDGNSVYSTSGRRRRGVNNDNTHQYRRSNSQRLLDMEERSDEVDYDNRWYRSNHHHHTRDNDNNNNNNVQEELENRNYYYSTTSSRRNNNYRPSSPSSYSSGSSHHGPPPMREIDIRNTTSIIDTIEHDRLMSEYGRLYGRHCSMLERMKILEVELRDMQTYLIVNGGVDVIGGSSSSSIIVGGDGLVVPSLLYGNSSLVKVAGRKDEAEDEVK